MTTTAPAVNIYTAYWLFRLDPAFQRLAEGERTSAKAAFLTALEQRPESVTLRGSYSLVGLREDADLLLWVIGPDLDAIQRLAVNLRHSGLGSWLTTTQSYVGVVTAARYDPGHQPAFMGGAEPKNFISVYPFVKTLEWYLLSYEERRRMMAEHGMVGRRFAVARAKTSASHGDGAGGEASNGARAAGSAVATESAVEEQGGGVLSNTVDAFGLGDYEFILANESDDPAELCRMMEALRAVEVRRYTRQDTPIFLGRRREPAEALADL